MLNYAYLYVMNNNWCPGHDVINIFHPHLSMKFQLIRKTKMLKNKHFFASKLSDVVFIMLLIVKMPTIVGI